MAKRQVGLSVIAVLPTLLAVLPASSAQASVDAYSIGTGTETYATVSWVGRYSFDVDTMSVYDTACDSNDVYGYFHVKRTYASETRTPSHYNSDGCGTHKTWTGLTFSTTTEISSFAVWSCVDDFGGNTCYYGVDNPNPYKQ